MKKHTLAFLAAGLLSLSALAQSPFNEAEIAKARAAGAAAAGAGGQTAFKVDENGNLATGEDGKPVATVKSAESLKGDLRMFQKNMGIESVDPVSSPGQAARTGLANLRVNQNFSFNCMATPGGVHGASALGFRIDGCDRDGPAVSAVRFSICDNAVKAGTCSVASDFSKPVRVTANQYSTFNGLSLGLGCNTVGTCQLTVTGAYTIGGNDATLKASATAAESTFRADLQKSMTDGDYNRQMTETAQAIVDSRDQQAGAQNQTQGQVCAAAPSCLKEAVSKTTFTKSCIRTFPLTEKRTHLTYSIKDVCEIQTFRKPLAGEVLKPDTNTCGVAPATAPKEGMELIRSTPKVCTPDPDPKVSECASEKWTEYWVSRTPDANPPVEFSPSGLGGACDDRTASETTHTTCASGDWFGRDPEVVKSLGCQGTFTNEATGTTTGGALELDFFLGREGKEGRTGCGFCLTPVVGTTCYGVDAPAATTGEYADSKNTCPDAKSGDLQACTLKAVVDVMATSGGGLVSSQREIYECSKESRQCVSWGPGSNDPACMTTDVAMGTDKMTPKVQANGTMNEAMVSAALVDATANGMELGSSDKVPKLFGGESMRCLRPVGGLGSMLQKNCCRSDLERPKEGNVIQGGCSLDEAKLAAARRSSYATYLGEYCSRSMKFPVRKCLEQTQSYCVFPGILPRLVQEQGRAQLAEMTSSSALAAVKKGPMSFSYLSTSANGSWAPPVELNGVRVTAWQWPAYCADPAKAAEIQLADPQAKECPGVVTTWFAACDLAQGCGALPDDPFEGSLHWSLKNANPLEPVTTAVSRYGAATGACSTETGNCQYQIAAWPVGTGGRAVVSKDLTWTLYSEEQPAASTQAPSTYQMNNIGDLMFKGYAMPGKVGGPLPPAVRLDFSRDGGQTWTTVQLPSSLKGQEMTLPNSEVTITGFCDSFSNTCDFRVVGTVAVSMHPWGSAQQPDCSGFTAGQISVLDFGKMDLSEWLSTVMAKAGATSPQALAAQANAQFQAFNSMFQGGRVKAAAPSATNFARIVPAEGFGPFDGKLAVAGYWPEVTGDPARDTDKVTHVEVDWDDCGLPENLPAVSPTEGIGFGAVHRYLTPDNASYPCKKAPGETNNIVHTIKLKVFTSKSGVQNKVVSVENAWSKFPGADSHNSNVTITREVPTQSSQVPTAPR